jgi:ATP-dependent protease HslVU (ClpYQ) peptidase subunit
MLLQVRRIGSSAVGGFAGVAVDGLALLEKLEAKLEEHPGQLLRASVELAKMWRQVRLFVRHIITCVRHTKGAVHCVQCMRAACAGCEGR